MTTVKKYLSLIKFSHTIFAMPFAMIGFFLAIIYMDRIPRVYAPFEKRDEPLEKIVLFFQFNWDLFLLVILCMVFARSAAMAFNRYLDRHFDAKNPRTAIREIPADHQSSAFIGSCPPEAESEQLKYSSPMSGTTSAPET